MVTKIRMAKDFRGGQPKQPRQTVTSSLALAHFRGTQPSLPCITRIRLVKGKTVAEGRGNAMVGRTELA